MQLYDCTTHWELTATDGLPNSVMIVVMYWYVCLCGKFEWQWSNCNPSVGASCTTWYFFWNDISWFACHVTPCVLTIWSSENASPEHEQRIWPQLGQVSLFLECMQYHCRICPDTGLVNSLLQSRQGCQSQCGHASGRHALLQSVVGNIKCSQSLCGSCLSWSVSYSYVDTAKDSKVGSWPEDILQHYLTTRGSSWCENSELACIQKR